MDGVKKVAAVAVVVLIAIFGVYYFFFERVWHFFECSTFFHPSDPCHTMTNVVITDDQIKDLGAKMQQARKDANNRATPGYGGDFYRDLQLKNSKDMMNEAEMHIRAIIQTDFYALAGIDTSDKSLDDPKWKGTNLETAWTIAKYNRTNQIDAHPDWTNTQWIEDARFEIIKCYLYGDNSGFFGEKPCQMIDDAAGKNVIPEDYQGVVGQTYTKTEITYTCTYQDIPQNQSEPTAPPLNQPPSSQPQGTGPTTASLDKNKKPTFNLMDLTTNNTPQVTLAKKDIVEEHPKPDCSAPPGKQFAGYSQQKTVTVYVSYPSRMEILMDFEQFSLIQPGKTTDQGDTYSKWIQYYLKELYDQNFDEGDLLLGSTGGIFIAPLEAGTYHWEQSFGHIGPDGKPHRGVDLGITQDPNLQVPIYAAGDGVVVWAGDAQNDPGYGNLILIKHSDKLYTLYGHISDWVVKPGDKVQQGQLIGATGNAGLGDPTNNHLHFEICEVMEGTHFCSRPSDQDPEDPKYGINFVKNSQSDAAVEKAATEYKQWKADGKIHFMPGFEGGALGSLSEKYESNGDPASVGWDSTGGASYGAWQIESMSGTIISFVSFLGENSTYDQYYKPLEPLVNNYSDVTSKDGQFASTWKQIAAQDPAGFKASQKAFIKTLFYDVQIRATDSTTGAQIEMRSGALKNVLWSTAVQMRNLTPEIFQNALQGKSSSQISDKDWIVNIYQERGAPNMQCTKYFSRSDYNTQQSVCDRYVHEMNDALRELAAEGGN